MDFPNGHADVVTVGGKTLLSVTFEPGFQWSRDLAPTVGAEKCPTRHLLHVVSGRMGLRLSDDSETEVGPGEVVSIAPGHDSWTVGQGPCLWFDYEPQR
ncbi:MAG: cupin [Acidimicrobiia bacterium]